jgi:hypothetical protein
MDTNVSAYLATRDRRRALMAERDAALAAHDHERWNALTVALAQLPMRGVASLTPADAAKYARTKSR